MTGSLHYVVVDARDPAALAVFGCAALGCAVLEEQDEGIRIAPPGGAPPALDVLLVPGAETGKNPLHLDVRPVAADQAAGLARLESRGARCAGVGQGPEASWVVLAGPEGNECCVLPGPEPE